MAPKIKGRKMKSVADARKSSKGGGGKGFITFIPEDGITVRLLAEPDEWWGFTEHYDDSIGFYPCTEGDCPGCDAGDRGSFRYLVPAVNREDDTVIILKVPKSLASDMVAKYDRRNTVLDRDYYFYREGTGKNDTKYKVDAEDASSFKFSKYEIPDLEAALVAAWERAFDEGGDDEDDDDEPRRRGSKRPAKSSTRRRPVDDDEDDDDDDDDEDDEPRRRVKRPAKSSTRRRPVDDDDDDEDDEPRRRVKRPATKKAVKKTPKRRTVRR